MTFTAIPGPSEADMIEELLLNCVEGGVVVYADLDAVLGRPFRENRSPYYAALKRVERRQRITYRTLPNIGYKRIDTAREAVVLTDDKHRRAGRQLQGARRKVHAGQNLQNLTPDERENLDNLDRRVGSLERAWTDLWKRQMRTEASMEGLAARVDEIEKRI